MRGTIPLGCGQCMHCRLNRRRLWTHRIMLESLKHSSSSFVTLTYNDDNLPDGGTLVPDDPKKWLKRFRRAIEPLQVRYYLVGEYGDRTERPHYHLALFGAGQEFTDIIEKTWKKGHVMVGTLTKDSASYIAGYVTKKMTKKDDPRLNGRYPEFARMSLKPGIGATAMRDVADALETEFGVDIIEENQDVPLSLSHGGKSYPLGPYLRRKLREEIGMEEKSTEEKIKPLQTEMLELFPEVFKNYENNPTLRKIMLKRKILKKYKQKRLNRERRTAIYAKEKTL